MLGSGLYRLESTLDFFCTPQPTNAVFTAFGLSFRYDDILGWQNKLVVFCIFCNL